MIEIEAIVEWDRSGQTFTDNRYSRAHRWRFDGGVEVPASASPHIVPEPYSNAENVDPEEAYIAALSSCHMLTFLSIAARNSYVVDSYRDRAVGTMTKNAQGRLHIDKVSLRPEIAYGAPGPDRSEEKRLHREAHEQCFIANSVLTAVSIELD